MSEWYTYRLSDFLMFTSSTYFRLFESSNRAWWPLHLVLVAAGYLAIYYGIKRKLPATRIASGMLYGFIWVWVAWEFHWVRYTPVMLAGPWFAGAFLLQGVALALGSYRFSDPDKRTPRDFWLGISLVSFGLVLQPLIGLIAHRPVVQLQVFGVAPDPTVTVTLGYLIFIRAKGPLFAIPLLWCMVTGMTLSALHAADSWIMPLVAMASFIGLATRRKAQ